MAWTQIDKENKKASDLAEASNLSCVEHGCGGTPDTWMDVIQDHRYYKPSEPLK